MRKKVFIYYAYYMKDLGTKKRECIFIGGMFCPGGQFRVEIIKNRSNFKVKIDCFGIKRV